MPDAPLSLRAYARRRGVSPEAVSKAVQTGRLKASVVDGKIVDPDLADREWNEHTRKRADVLPSMPPTTSAAPSTPTELRNVPGEQVGTQPSSRPAVQPSRADAPLPDGDDDAGDVPPYHRSQAIRAHHQARREAAMADMAELELGKRRGELVDAADADAGYEEHIARARTRLLGVPAQLGQRLPDLALRVVPVAKELIREALEELSLDGQS